MKKRITSVLLTLCMVLSLLPAEALAAETHDGRQKVVAQQQADDAISEDSQVSGLDTEKTRAKASKFPEEESKNDEKAASENEDASSLLDDSFTGTENAEDMDAPSSASSVALSSNMKSDSFYKSFTPYDGASYSLKYYEKNDGTLSISGYTGTAEGELIIPKSIEGKMVTEIADYAFKNCSGFTGSLEIPGSMTTIGDYAFENCSGFTGSLEIPDSVTTIEWGAFDDCYGFTGDLIIGDSVTGIKANTFYGCSGFTGNLIIGNSVAQIEWCAFYRCSGFTGNLVIPESVTEIGGLAFYCCSGFTGNLVIGNGVTTIEREAFQGCSGFTGSLTIGNSVTEIEHDAFNGCSGFTGSLVIPDSVTIIGEKAFQACSGFTGSLVIPDSVTIIDGFAFSGCSGFTGSLTISNSVTKINYCAFSGCNGFTGSLVIPDSVTIIDSFAFSSCSGFTGSLVIPDSVTEIRGRAFENCSGFTGGLVIPDSVTIIDIYAFSGCSGLTGSLVIPNNVTEIGREAFSNCSGFTGSLVIPDSVTKIEWSAFSGCSGFTGILVIPNNVTEIGREAFFGCSGLTNAIVPTSVAKIGYDAFTGCNSLKDIYYSGSEAQWKAIDGTSNTPYGVTIHYQSAPQDSFGTVMYLSEWDSVNRALSFADTPLQYRLVGNPTEAPEDLVGKYVLVYTDPNNLFDVADIQSVDSHIGTVTASTETALTIDGIAYSVDDDPILSFYVGKNVLYHLKDGKIVGLSLLEKRTGIINNWNGTTKELTIDWKVYPTNSITDISFLANIDQNFNKVATFFVPSDNTYTPILKITDYAEPAPGSLLEGFCFTANTPMNSISLGSTIDLYVGYYDSNRLDTRVKDYLTVVENSEIVSIQEKGWNYSYGQHYQVTAKGVGKTIITVSHPYYGDATPLEILVVPTDTAYSFDSVPKMTVEDGKVTNFYNYEGLVVDEFSYSEHKADNGDVDYYNVNMNIYNSRNLYGAVISYDSKGNVDSFQVIDRYDILPSNFVGSAKDLWNQTTDLFYMIKNKNNHYYSGESISKMTPIREFRVPAGGYLSISNNADASNIVMAANLIGITIDVVKTAGKLHKYASKVDDPPKIIEALTKDYVNEKLIDVIKNTAKEELKSGNWNCANIGEVIQSILVRLNEYGINLAEQVGNKIVSVSGGLSIGESVAMNIIPTGQLIKLLYTCNNAANVAVNSINLCISVSFANGIYIYAPTESNSYQSNGITVTSQSGLADDIVVHAYMISDIPLMDHASAAVQAKYYWQDNESSIYNIAMYKNGMEVQPASSVEVRIPLPDQFKEDVSKIRVYRQNDDGSVTNMDAVIMDGYAVFSTDHFSYYAVVNQENVTIGVSDIGISDDVVTINAVVYCSLAKKVTVCCAFYNEAGQMVDFKVSDATSENEGFCTFVSNKSVSAVKIFAIDSNSVPQCVCRRIKL